MQIAGNDFCAMIRSLCFVPASVERSGETTYGQLVLTVAGSLLL